MLVVTPPLCYPKSKFRALRYPMSQFPAPQQAALRVVGQSVTRVDAHSKITGAAEFSGDRLSVENLLYGKTLRSPHAHAQIVAIDTAKAQALPGVRAVITYRDVPAIPFEAGDDSGSDGAVAPVYLLNRTLRHVGDEVAAIAADSEEIAEEALRLIQVDYRPLPFVLNEERALEADAPSVRGGANLAGKEAIEFSRGDIDLGMREAAQIFEQTYRTQSTSPLALEPRYAVASWQGDRLTVWKASRNVYGDRDKLAKTFSLPPDRVRVLATYLGGGFGSKDETRLGLITALLARQAGQPVRMGYSREEELGYGKWRHATTTRIRMGIKADGTISRHRHHQRAQHRPLRAGLRRRFPAGPRAHLSLQLRQRALRRQSRLHQQSRGRLLSRPRRAAGPFRPGILRRRSRGKFTHRPAGVPLAPLRGRRRPTGRARDGT